MTAEKIHPKDAANAAAAFEALFQENWSRIYAVLYRLVGDRFEAEDLALETFWRLYRHPPALTQPDEPRGWLYRVATRLGFNALRARKRRQRYQEEAGSQVIDNGPTWDPAAELERAQERDRVRAALAQMKPRSAQLLMLRHSGLSYAELASALEISAGSVGTLLARAEQEFEMCYRKLEGG